MKTPNLVACQIPIINIPTSLSGGEYSHNGGATDMRTHRKSSFAHPSMGASLVILDPTLSVSTPERIWISSGMRAVDHCVEGLCSTSSNVGDASEEAFKTGLKLLVSNLLRTRRVWDDLDARLNEMMGVVEAMKGSKHSEALLLRTCVCKTDSIRVSLGVPMGASHAIGHQLGPLGVGHGETSCVMLPHVLKYNYLHGDQPVKNLQKKILAVFWGEEEVAIMLKRRGFDPATADAGDVVGAFVSELGMPRTLKDVNVTRDKLDNLAENSMKDRWIPTNPVPLKNKEMVLEVLEMALGNEI